MKKTYYYAILTILILWEITALLIGNSIILPSVFNVFKSLIKLIFETKTYMIIIMTLFRITIATIISFLFALFLSTLSFKYHKFKDFFHIFYIILKTIPNIAIIIICLIWFGREGSISLIVFLVMFPIMYSNFLFGFENIDDDIMQNTILYNGSFMIKWWNIYLPLISNNILESLKNTISLGFKVTIMSELLAQVRWGIGKEIYFNKINLEMSEIFAWTIIMIFLSTIIEYVLNIIIKRYKI